MRNDPTIANQTNTALKGNRPRHKPLPKRSQEVYDHCKAGAQLYNVPYGGMTRNSIVRQRFGSLMHIRIHRRGTSYLLVSKEGEVLGFVGWRTVKLLLDLGLIVERDPWHVELRDDVSLVYRRYGAA
jgi:hypothetical protein